jgi:glycerophosphoryl diester phosphodiesterase
MIRYAREHGIKVIPWTVNSTEAFESLIAFGVDGIITDYPDLIPEATPQK